MTRMAIATLFTLTLLSSAFAGSARTLLQANPPAASFGGPLVPPADNVKAPANTFAKINWRGVGTQNFSSGSDSQYAPAGAVANLYLQSSPATLVGTHFFIDNGAGGISPVFTRIDASTGQETGRVIGSVIATDPTSATNDDGGYGSIPNALLSVSSATGFFDGVTVITRVNCSGGVVPGNPKLFTLPASPQGVANALLAVPYQADYKFWVVGESPSSG